MSNYARVVIAVLWIISLVIVGSLVHAQVIMPKPFEKPMLLSGPDVGFRAEAQQGSAITGRLVVRVNGQWVEAIVAPGRTTTPASVR